MKHILIHGRRGAGKSTMIEKLVSELDGPVYGFYTRTVRTNDAGYHQIYMYPAGSVERPTSEENHVGDCNTRERTINLRVFDTLGVEYLHAQAGGILVMDEIGFMEQDSELFCEAVLQALDGDIPVLAGVKAGMDVPFLHRVLEHPKVEVYELNPDNRQEIYEQILPQVRNWNEALRRC